jgi:hypothetical protein
MTSRLKRAGATMAEAFGLNKSWVFSGCWGQKPLGSSKTKPLKQANTPKI